MQHMANQHGDFIWYELLTTDADAAARFYGAVIGWRTGPRKAPLAYGIFGNGDTDVGGFMRLPEGAERAGMRPKWLGYVAVEESMRRRPTSSGPAAPSICRPPTSRRRPLRDAVRIRKAWRSTSCAARWTERARRSTRASPAIAIGTNSPPATRRPPLPSTAPASAGRRAMRCPWARWATTSSSPMAARRSAP